MEFPTNGNQKTWQLRQSLVDRWREAFPAVDIEAECRKALAWLESNPTKRKTANGMPRFLNSWLGRVQDRSGSVAAGAPRSAKQYPTSKDWDDAFKDWVDAAPKSEGGAA
jgi:hypothetical protein